MRYFNIGTTATRPPTPSNNNFIMPLRMSFGTPPPTPFINQIANNNNTNSTIPLVNKVKWGEPTWFLLHTLSVKIKDEQFPRIRQYLLNTIYAICVNLPCPTCAEHAKSYLDGINFNTIQTKEQLKQMLHAFHNSVNQRKGYPFFPYDQLDSKYSLAITNNILVNFMNHFTERNYNIKLVAQEFTRNQLCNQLKQWFNQNIHAFHP